MHQTECFVFVCMCERNLYVCNRKEFSIFRIKCTTRLHLHKVFAYSRAKKDKVGFFLAPPQKRWRQREKYAKHIDFLCFAHFGLFTSYFVNFFNFIQIVVFAISIKVFFCQLWCYCVVLRWKVVVFSISNFWRLSSIKARMHPGATSTFRLMQIL